MLAYFSLFLSLISGVLSCELCRHHLPLLLKSSGRVGSVQLDWFTVAHFLTTRRIFAVLRVSEFFEACCRTLLLQTAQETETFNFPNFFLCSFFSVSLNNWLWAGITSYRCKQRVSRWKHVLWAPVFVLLWQFLHVFPFLPLTWFAANSTLLHKHQLPVSKWLLSPTRLHSAA